MKREAERAGVWAGANWRGWTGPGSAFYDTRPGAFDGAEVAREVGEAGGSGIRGHRLARSIEIEAAHLVQREPGNEVKRGGRGFQPPLLELGQSDFLTQARDGVVEHVHVLGGAW